MIYYQAHVNGSLSRAEDYLASQEEVEKLALEILSGNSDQIVIGHWALIRSGGYFFPVRDLFKSPKQLIFDSENPELEFSAWEMARIRAINWAFKKQPQATKEVA